MLFEANKSLKNFNTFGIDCKARRFVSVTSVAELKIVLSENQDERLFFLGGGSNMLLVNDLDFLVIHLNLKGIKILSEEKNQVLLKVMAGENWHEFVIYCLKNNFGGVENLSLIPGNVGTSPIQNIGAYGTELKDIFVSCETVEIKTQKERTFSKAECKFGYRDSIFKNEAKNKFIITSVTFNLTKFEHKSNIEYGAIKGELQKLEITNPTIQDISRAVIAIRQSKLPDPNKLGNSGSFFKNPVITEKAFNIFQSKFPEAPFYELESGDFKIPAGWLIEQAGFKGKRFGDAGIHKNQALVLVNYGNATGNEIWDLALKIQEEVAEKFGITIEPEVNIL